MGLESLLKQHKELLIGRWITDLANTSAFIFSEIKDINWAGFYLFEDDILVLGPFQGKPACTTITLDRGVCGAAARDRKIMIVPDVHDFEGHVTCDPLSRSEMVVPIVENNVLLGVLDVDSPQKNRFNEEENEFFSRVVEQLLESRQAGAGSFRH